MTAKGNGFTLLEVLVVVALLSISAAFLVPNLFPDPERALKKEALRLADALQHASLAAQWRGEPLAWSADASGYRFWRADPTLTQASDDMRSGWRVLNDDDVLLPYALPASRRIQLLRIGSRPVAESWFVFRADGANEPYTIVVAADKFHFAVHGDPLNRVTLAAQPSPHISRGTRDDGG